MEIKEYLDEFSKINCPCGKEHKMTVKDIIVKSGAIKELPALINKYNAKKPFILADINTFSVAGKAVLAVLDEANISYSKYVFKEKHLEPDEKAVGSAVMNYDQTSDLIIAVGSGVINDIGKVLATAVGADYFIVGTAPSMDGYASSTSSMVRNGLKVSLEGKCPDAIIGDIDILKNAPIKMLQAGIGDMLAKYISIAEWKIAREILDEYYCDRVANLIKLALKECVDNAEGLLLRDEKAIKAVFNGLVIGGVAMAFVGISRPASGVEHYFSHILDMRGLQFNEKVDFHGTQCAVATLICAKLYEKLLLITPDKNKALSHVKAFDYNNHKKLLKEFLGQSAIPMIEKEKTEKKYCKKKHKKRLEVILSKWDKIKEIIEKEIPSPNELERILDKIGAPKTYKELGIKVDEFTVFSVAKDIREKYGLSRLLWDLGEMELFYD